MQGSRGRIERVTRFPYSVHGFREAQVPSPQWNLISEVLDPKVMGYAYAVLKDGQPPIYHSYGNARAPVDCPRDGNGNIDPNARKAFTADTRINIASGSKAVCGVAVMKAL